MVNHVPGYQYPLSQTVLPQYWNCQSQVYSQIDDQPNQFHMPQNDHEMCEKSNSDIYSNHSRLVQIIVTIYTDLLMNIILQMPARFRTVTPLKLYDYPNTNEATLKEMGKQTNI